MYVKLSEDEKQKRRDQRKKDRELTKYKDEINNQKNQKPVKEITISIEWKKSRMWGSNPCASAEIKFVDGSYLRSNNYTANGCGYCKESTVIADIFNDFLRYRLWQIKDKDLEKPSIIPYGIQIYNSINRLEIKKDNRYYEGGVGTNCYTSISEFVGGEFENIASGKTFDVFKFTSKV